MRDPAPVFPLSPLNTNFPLRHPPPAAPKLSLTMSTYFSNVRLFDGYDVHQHSHVLVEAGKIAALSSTPFAVPSGATLVDGTGKTLLPGFIDAHVHAQAPALEQNILFGVTTCLDMFSMPDWMDDLRISAASSNAVADIRSGSCGGTVLKGHPSMLIGPFFPRQFPTIATVEDIPGFVADRVKEGADYIKFIVDDGTALSHHGQPTLSADMAKALVQEAHKHGLMAICHALDHKAAGIAVDAGVDGLIHVWYDTPSAPDIVEKIVKAGIWVTSTIVTLGALAGELTGANLATDSNAMSQLPVALHGNIQCCWIDHKIEPASTANALANIRALHEAGVPILCGTDACGILGLGAVYGVSFHGELRYLVEAGLTPIEALRTGTSIPAVKFGLKDRGFVRAGFNADLVLVNGDPTTAIEDAVKIDSVWRNGEKVDRVQARAVVDKAVEAKAEGIRVAKAAVA
ncbi:hypothetical protein RQP46_010935 [Phenoliferia psychrophenolica]